MLRIRFFRNALVALLALQPRAMLLAQDDRTELYTCSFVGHTPVGTLRGACTTQGLPAAEGYIARWRLTLTVDQRFSTAAARIEPDRFYDMVRGQCLENGNFTTLIPLWGDFLIKPNDPDYISGNKACSPIYQTAPNVITVSRDSTTPLTVQFLIEERMSDYTSATGLPTPEWMLHYLESFQRLQLSPKNMSSHQ
jgi:hypothetical protein